MTTTTRRSERLCLRLTPQAKRTLNAAASAQHQSLSEFVLQSALAHAQEILPDRTQFFLNAKQWEAFLAALDKPARPMPRLARLLNEPSMLERKRR